MGTTMKTIRDFINLVEADEIGFAIGKQLECHWNFKWGFDTELMLLYELPSPTCFQLGGECFIGCLGGLDIGSTVELKLDVPVLGTVSFGDCHR